MSMPKVSALSLAVTTAVACAGCASYSKLDPGTTAGKIEVSGVRVSSRERMVNERLKRREFLESQLTAAQALKDTDFAPDGGFSIRSFSGVGAGLGVSLDAGSAQLAKLGKARDAQRIRNQQEMDVKDQEILLAIREKLLADVKGGKTSPEDAEKLMNALKPPNSGGTTPEGTKPPDPTEAAKWRAAIDSLLKSVADPAAPPQATTIKASPIDLFRDKLALLEEIRSEMAANELDDRHDLYGSTLVRLSVDATLIPDGDTSAWGVVEMRVRPIIDADTFTPKGFIERLNDLATERMVRAKRQYVKACYGNNPEVDEERTTANAATRFAFTDRKIDSKRRKYTNDILEGTSTAISDALQRMRNPITGSKNKQSFCDRDFETEHLFSLVDKVFHTEILATSLSSPQESIDLFDVIDLKSKKNGAFEFDSKTDKDKDSLQAWLNEAHKSVKSLPYAYAATPKEQVQRISQSGSRRDAMELMLALQAVSGAGSASGAISMMQANEVISSALHRQPLVVGYSRTPVNEEDKYRRVGWVLGPRFKVEQDMRGRPEFGFRHRIVQNTLNAEVAVPQLASGLEVVMCGGWRNEREAATTAGGAGECPAGMTVIGRETVFLPQNPEALAETFDPDARRPYPELYARRLIPQGVSADVQKAGAVAAGSTVRSVLMLQGVNLWRNPQVFVGSIKASEVLVLSDMRGIQATFDVSPETLADCKADRSVTVVTSTGSVDFGPAGGCTKVDAPAVTPDTKAAKTASPKAPVKK